MEIKLPKNVELESIEGQIESFFDTEEKKQSLGRQAFYSGVATKDSSLLFLLLRTLNFEKLLSSGGQKGRWLVRIFCRFFNPVAHFMISVVVILQIKFLR